jgi:hypothetical protein
MESSAVGDASRLTQATRSRSAIARVPERSLDPRGDLRQRGVVPDGEVNDLGGTVHHLMGSERVPSGQQQAVSFEDGRRRAYAPQRGGRPPASIGQLSPLRRPRAAGTPRAPTRCALQHSVRSEEGRIQSYFPSSMAILAKAGTAQHAGDNDTGHPVVERLFIACARRIGAGDSGRFSLLCRSRPCCTSGGCRSCSGR